MMGGLLHLIQRGGAWAGWGPAQSPHRCMERLGHSETTPIGGQVATGLLYCTACRLELWDSDAVFITQNLDVG